MRLSAFDRQAIVESVREFYGPAAHPFLFGSRTDDEKHGGDIDILIEIPSSEKDSMSRKLLAVGRIQRRIGEQKVDLVVTDCSPEVEELLIVRNARKHGVPL